MGRAPRRERGIAALTAMLVVALATVLAVSLLWNTSVDMQRTETLLLQDQAREIDLGFESVALTILAAMARSNGSDATFSQSDLDEVNNLPPQTVEGGEAHVNLEDGQGRFNLNDLIDGNGKPTKKLEQFQRMLQALELPDRPPLSPSEAQSLAESVVDWIDPDNDPQPGGAELSFYNGLQPPYQPANFWFTSTSELLAVKTPDPDLYFTREIYAALRPHIVALPPQADGAPYPLNVNTASSLVLNALVPDPPAGGVTLAPKDGYKTVADFLEFNKDLQPVQNLLTVNSDWFTLTVTTSIGTTRATMYSLLERDGQNVRPRLRTFDAE